jgi:hypothetical protein
VPRHRRVSPGAHPFEVTAEDKDNRPAFCEARSASQPGGSGGSSPRGYIETPIGIEPMTYALRVKRGSSTGVHTRPRPQLSADLHGRLVHAGPRVSRAVVSIRVSTLTHHHSPRPLRRPRRCQRGCRTARTDLGGLSTRDRDSASCRSGSIWRGKSGRLAASAPPAAQERRVCHPSRLIEGSEVVPRGQRVGVIGPKYPLLVRQDPLKKRPCLSAPRSPAVHRTVPAARRTHKTAALVTMATTISRHRRPAFGLRPSLRRLGASPPSLRVPDRLVHKSVHTNCCSPSRIWVLLGSASFLAGWRSHVLSMCP